MVKKHSFNILFFSLTLGALFPSQGWSADQPAMNNEAAAVPAAPAPSAEPVQGMPSENHGAEAKPDAAAHAGQEAHTESTVEEKKAHGEETAAEEKGTEKKKGKKKGKKKSKKHGKGSTSSVCQPPADVISKLDARNNTNEAPVVCSTGPSCETSSVAVTEGNSEG